MITRNMYVTIGMQCCKDGDPVYFPEPRPGFYQQIRAYFDTTLEEWKKIRGDKVEVRAKKEAEDECKGLGTPRLCNFKFVIDKVEEFGECPEFVKSGLRILVQRYEKMEEGFRKQNLKKLIYDRMKEYGCTEEEIWKKPKKIKK